MTVRRGSAAAVVALVALTVLSGCSAGVPGPTEQPGQSAADPSDPGEDPIEGAAVRRADLTLEYTLDASTENGSRSRAGAAGPTVAASGIDVVAPLSPIQYLRYLSLPFDASAHVETVLGPTTVGCVALWSTRAPDATNDAAAALRCRLPRQVETAPGLRSTLTIRSRTVKDALLVPNLYIGYDEATNGYFVMVRRGAAAAKVALRVGPSDGVVRVVHGDVAPGDRLVRPDTEVP